MFLFAYRLAVEAKWSLIHAALLIALGCGMSYQVAAQSSQWKADSILSQYLIYQIQQGPDGFLWVATDNGIYRYDGYQAIPLSRLMPGHAPLPPAAYKMAMGRKGDIWLMGEAGLFRYCPTKQRLTTIPLARPATDFPSDVVMVADTVHNRLWLNQGAHQLVALTLDQGKEVPGSHHVFRRQIDWMTTAATGEVWVVTADHVLTCFAPGCPTRQYKGPGMRRIYPLLNTQPQQFFSACAQYTAAPDGSLHEVYRWLPSHFGVFTEESLFLPSVQAGAEQWVFGRQLVRVQRAAHSGQPLGALAEVQDFNNSLGYARPPNYHLFTDKLGVEWSFSSLMRGCYKRRGSASIQALPSEKGDFYSTRAIMRTTSGQLIVSSYTSLMRQPAHQPAAPLQRWVPLSADLFVANDLLPLPKRPHQMLVAMENSSIYELNTQTCDFKPLDLVPAHPLRAVDLAYGPKGRVWAATQVGLFWLDTAQLHVHAYRPARAVKPLRDIKALAFDQEGYLWLATSHGLSRLTPSTGQLREFNQQSPPPYRLPTDELLSVYPVKNRVWVGTRDQGLLLIDSKRGVIRQVTKASGLPSNTVCSLLADQQGDLWLGTYAGVVRYQPATGAMATFTTADGLADNECNYQSAFRDTNGDLYFGSVKGITRLVPQLLLGQGSAQRRLVVSRIARYPAGDTTTRVSYPTQQGGQTLDLTDDDQAAVQVALTDYLSPESTRYRYRLKGLVDTTWHYFTSQRLIRLFKLPVGSYTLVVQGEAANGFMATNTLHLPIEVRRTWWKYSAVWVTAGVLILSTGLVYIYYSRRQHQQQQLQLRQRLAYDLHDELGSLLFRASLQAELLKKEALFGRVASHILNDLHAASYAMRDIVWGIDPQANSIGDLLNRMQEYLDQTANPTNRHLELQTEHLQVNKPLPLPLRQHIYAVFKEAVTNSLRHAQHSTLLIVCLKQQRQQLVLSVRDDGQPTELGRRGGIGLRSMRQRAQEMAGHLEVIALPEGGVLVQLVVLLPS